MQYKSRLSSKPPVAARGVQMRIKRRDITPSSTGGDGKGGSVGPTSLSTTRIRGSMSLQLFGNEEGSIGEKLRKQQMMNELLLKRALNPPPKRLTLRWKNFQPTPSRLSIMSTA